MRQALLTSIAGTIADYRAGQIAAPDAAHVDRWISQFDPAVQVPLLEEMDHVLKKSYFPRTNVLSFLDAVATSAKLCGGTPANFWKDVQLLDIQGGGASQKDLNTELAGLLAVGGISLAGSASAATKFVYLDDGLFTGNRTRRDVESWVKNQAPSPCDLYVIVIALHTGGHFYANREIAKTIQASGKAITVHWWRAIELKDQRAETNDSDVLRPTAIPNDALVQAYAGALKYPPVLRAPGNVGPAGLFSSDTGRQLIEQEFLKVGAHIRKICPNLGETQRPLGHMTLQTLGFGSMIATYRNCPNNAPLVLWVDDPWYPLFPRKTNSDTAFAQMFKKS